MEVKRLSGTKRKRDEANQSFGDQPISPFRLFMEDFMKSCKRGNRIEMDRTGFEKWKSMSNEERQLYVFQAELVNFAHQETLNIEANDMTKVQDEEADSSMVGMFDKFYWIYEESSDYSSDYFSSSSSYSSSSSENSSSK